MGAVVGFRAHSFLQSQTQRTYRMKLFTWLQSIFSESDGTGSESRVASAVVLFGSLGLVYFATLFKTEIPPSAETILKSLIAAVVVKYGANKFLNKSPSQAVETPETRQQP